MTAIVGTTRRTVVRKLLFLEKLADRRHALLLESLTGGGKQIESIQFDEMESWERSKCLPVSIPLIVAADTRKILAIGACSMPPKGPLAEFSRRKYGRRADERAQSVRGLFHSIEKYVHPRARWSTDQNPRYPAWLREVFPEATHLTTTGRRGCVVGQGELKRGKFDPLFSINHTCAMIRANVNRLFRRTWCTTKRRDRLAAHLKIYMDYHNTVLT